jgi:transposase
MAIPVQGLFSQERLVKATSERVDVVKRAKAILAALPIAPGRGRKEAYTLLERERIVQEFGRAPDPEHDQTATWSLMTLRGALRKEALPTVGASTIREVLHETGYRFGKTRMWCPTGTALRVRKTGTVTVQDPKAGEKNT